LEGGALGSLGINPPFLLSQIVNFLILFAVLRLLLWKRILKMLEQRKQRIAQSLADAEQARKDRERAEAEYQQRIERAEQEREEILAKAAEEGEQAGEQVLAEARTEADRIIAEAQAELERDRQEMLAELRGQVASLAIAVSNKIIGEALDEQRQRRLIDEFFSGIQAGRVVVLDEEEIEWVKRTGTMTAHVTTALPLSTGEQETVASSLAAHLGEKPELEFKVDPGILGGLVIQIGDRVIDGSVAGKLTALQEQLG
jgi:F-type H+-transporting ATPase subunit b